MKQQNLEEQGNRREKKETKGEKKKKKKNEKKTHTYLCFMWSLYEVINCTACLHVSVTNDLHIYTNSTRV